MNDTWLAGPEVGLKYFVNSTTFTEVSAAYEFDLENGLDNGAFFYGLGVGFKWLCGPYGTGYVWLRPDLLRSLTFNQAYWLAQMTADAFVSAHVSLRHACGLRRKRETS